MPQFYACKYKYSDLSSSFLMGWGPLVEIMQYVQLLKQPMLVDSACKNGDKECTCTLKFVYLL